MNIRVWVFVNKIEANNHISSRHYYPKINIEQKFSGIRQFLTHTYTLIDILKYSQRMKCYTINVRSCSRFNYIILVAK